MRASSSSSWGVYRLNRFQPTAVYTDSIIKHNPRNPCNPPRNFPIGNKLMLTNFIRGRQRPQNPIAGESLWLGSSFRYCW